MKNYKKLLIIVTAALITCSISAALSLGIEEFLSFKFWPTFWFITVLQLIFPSIKDCCVDVFILKKAADEYRKKEYKKYNFPLRCSYCNADNAVDIDLTDTTFRCEKCKRKNAIYLNFTVASLTNEDEA